MVNLYTLKMLHVFLFVLSGVLVCGVSLVTEMCRVNPETLTHFRRVCWELFSSPHFKLTYTDMHVTIYGVFIFNGFFSYMCISHYYYNYC